MPQTNTEEGVEGSSYDSQGPCPPQISAIQNTPASSDRYQRHQFKIMQVTYQQTVFIAENILINLTGKKKV